MSASDVRQTGSDVGFRVAPGQPSASWRQRRGKSILLKLLAGRLPGEEDDVDLGPFAKAR